jgi:hypothetical protein
LFRAVCSQRGCCPTGKTDAAREVKAMGGKPNPGTKKDKRLKSNKPKKK